VSTQTGTPTAIASPPEAFASREHPNSRRTRLLFRLLPDRVQVLDLINRRDLDRRIKTLRTAG
jgi:hypothetical protein